MPDSDNTSFSDFTDRDADSLAGMVDFVGIVKTGFLAAFAGLISGIVGGVLSVTRGIDALGGAIADSQREVVTSIADIPGETFEGAVQVAEADLLTFQLFGLPVSVGVVLLTMLVFSLVVYVGRRVVI